MTLLPPMRMRSSSFSLIDNPHYTLYWERKMKLYTWRNAQIWHCPSFSHNFKGWRGTSPCLFTFRYPRETQDELTPLQDKWDEREPRDTSAIDWEQTDSSLRNYSGFFIRFYYSKPWKVSPEAWSSVRFPCVGVVLAWSEPMGEPSSSHTDEDQRVLRHRFCLPPSPLIFHQTSLPACLHYVSFAAWSQDHKTGF